ncbi:aminotransferase class V-fold PLP-dependent enzyme [Mameliella alba]|nr:aminotransferase class V-fold PLP-dependent enzyme [Antarctobacter heliothermus]MBY6145614.1 aminotransferase class V-fold PLP-dependent enzyme [Mameliella alba]MCA0955622.1 aminotransferase class V-fold PLP-dependent enzyme [Mameliella alba]
MSRVYLDHNATTPLRAEAREAMLRAMDVVGNPSSVHAEGRAAKGLVEAARAQVAALVGCLPTQVVFTGSATEAAALAVAQKERHGGDFAALATEHDCFAAWSAVDLPSLHPVAGPVPETVDDLARGRLLAVSAANSETGITFGGEVVASPEGGAVVCDITQLAGKVAPRYPGGRKPAYMILSAHKIGGPKGVGALINFTRDDPQPILRGGGQEMGRRSGTENVIGIAGFGAAAEAARHDVESGAWARVEKLRNILEESLEAASDVTIFVGKDSSRLPNTTCFATPGWKGETQVMQMDLAGFAVSAGSACSSGKVRRSRVLEAMGYEEDVSSSAIRVSLGLDTTEDDVSRFCAAWIGKYKRHRDRAA